MRPDAESHSGTLERSSGFDETGGPLHHFPSEANTSPSSRLARVCHGLRTIPSSLKRTLAGTLSEMRAVSLRARLRWGAKVGAATAVVAFLGWGFLDRYQIGVDTQAVKCVKGSIFLIDTKDLTPERGAMFAYRSKGTKWIFPDGTLMVKYLEGMPGDQVEVTEDFEVLVNGVRKARGLPLATAISAEEARMRFCGKGTLKSDEAWMLGTLPRSFDSRYWGPIKTDQLVGRAYVLF